MRKLSFTVVFSLVIFNTVCFSDSSVAIASTSCDNKVELGEQTIFCLVKQDIIPDRTKIITNRLQSVVSNLNYDLSEIRVLLNSQKIPTQITIDNPDGSNIDTLITILEGDTSSDGVALDTFESSALQRLITLELQNRRKELILSGQSNIPISETETTRQFSPEWFDEILGSVSKILTGLLLLAFALYVIWKSGKQLLCSPKDMDDGKRDEVGTSIANAVRSVKKGLSQVQEEGGKPNQKAIFSLGSATVNLKTVADESGNLKVVPSPLLESSSSFSNQKTQDLTLVFNPLKVFSGTSCTLKIVYRDQINNEFSKQNPSYYSEVTEADFVDVKDKTYLWINKKSGIELLYKAHNLVNQANNLVSKGQKIKNLSDEELGKVNKLLSKITTIKNNNTNLDNLTENLQSFVDGLNQVKTLVYEVKNLEINNLEEQQLETISNLITEVDKVQTNNINISILERIVVQLNQVNNWANEVKNIDKINLINKIIQLTNKVNKIKTNDISRDDLKNIINQLDEVKSLADEAKNLHTLDLSEHESTKVNNLTTKVKTINTNNINEDNLQPLTTSLEYLNSLANTVKDIDKINSINEVVLLADEINNIETNSINIDSLNSIFTKTNQLKQLAKRFGNIENEKLTLEQSSTLTLLVSEVENIYASCEQIWIDASNITNISYTENSPKNTSEKSIETLEQSELEKLTSAIDKINNICLIKFYFGTQKRLQDLRQKFFGGG